MQAEEYRKMFELEETFWWYRGMMKITREVLGRYFQSAGNVRILDAGCGTGKMLLELKQYSLRQPLDSMFRRTLESF